MNARLKPYKRRAGVAFACLWLSGCGLLSLPGTGPAPVIYDLSPKSTFDDNLPEIRAQVIVEEPSAARGIDSDRIALRPRPIEIKYFAGSRWSARAPKMVQTLLVESFENTGKIVAIGRQSIGLRSDYVIKSELREFQAEYYNSVITPEIHVRLNLKLIKMPEARIVASQTFERTELATGKDVPAIIESFDETLGKVLRRSVEWSLREVDARVKQPDGQEAEQDSEAMSR